jgi:hypothetical protein
MILYNSSDTSLQSGMQFSSYINFNEINQKNFESTNSLKLGLIALERKRGWAQGGGVYNGNFDGHFMKIHSVLLELFVTCDCMERQTWPYFSTSTVNAHKQLNKCKFAVEQAW